MRRGWQSTWITSTLNIAGYQKRRLTRTKRPIVMVRRRGHCNLSGQQFISKFGHPYHIQVAAPLREKFVAMNET